MAADGAFLGKDGLVLGYKRKEASMIESDALEGRVQAKCLGCVPYFYRKIQSLG